MTIKTTLALDLEGTLITDQTDIFARPGLFEFLLFCEENFKLVMMTTVKEQIFTEIANKLTQIGHVPDWFCDISYVTMKGT